MRCVTRSLFVARPRVSVIQGGRHHRRVNPVGAIIGLEVGGLQAGLCKGGIIAASEDEQSDLFAQACRWRLLRGFPVLRFRAIEVARDDLNPAIEVMFEHLHRAFNVAVFHGP